MISFQKHQLVTEMQSFNAKEWSWLWAGHYKVIVTSRIPIASVIAKGIGCAWRAWSTYLPAAPVKEILPEPVGCGALFVGHWRPCQAKPLGHII